MSRLARAFIAALTALCLLAPGASAQPTRKLNRYLGALWTTVLETPSAENPFGSGGADFSCLNIGARVIAPFGPTGVDSCTVASGTKLFVAGSAFECSTFEGNGTTETELRECARSHDAPTAPAVTVDGRAVTVFEAETQL